MSGRQAVYQLWCGIDVAAKTFTVSWTLNRSAFSQPITLLQTPDGIASLQQHLRELEILPSETLIVLEATGSYWVRLAVDLSP